MSTTMITGLVAGFLQQYDAALKDAVWKQQSNTFRVFWTQRVMGPGSERLSDEECDAIIRILDRNGKGNSKDTEAVARAMVAQGAWRRMFNDFRANKELAELLNRILVEPLPDRKAELIDQLYENNKDRKNNLTGPSGNTISAFLAAYDPLNNLSIISLNDRKLLLDFLGIAVSFDWNNTSTGRLIVQSNTTLLDGLRACGLSGSARTASVFCYTPAMRALWKGEHTVKITDKNISVTVPPNREVDESEKPEESDILRESLMIQCYLAEIGSRMGMKIWLPKSDRTRILTVLKSEHARDVLNELPLINDDMILKTIEQIDVIWLKGRSIIRAFEVEHTTSVYSGLLRMADLLALQPNININLHIVAPAARRDKVFQEIRRPVFQLMEGGPLSGKCSYLSYESVRDLRDTKHLNRLSAAVIEDYEERAEDV